jgi:RIO kinase 1
MKAPESLETLVEYGIIQEVVRPLMSGKEAQVYLVMAAGEECVAKVYKEATHRTFKHRSDYTEGRRTRNTRDQRAMSKRTQHGRKKDEDAWRSTEVDMIYRLRDAGVRVPEPHNFVEGVLVMELVKDAEGEAAPRLGDLDFSPTEAKDIYTQLIREVIRMLCAGVIHGDLSEFNVLLGRDGPVVIDFPQAVDPTHNPNGEKLLLRDVENLHRFLARFAPEETIKPLGQEIWSLYQSNKLSPDTELGGTYRAPEGKANTEEVMALIEDADRDERWRRGERPSRDEDDFEGPARSPVVAATPFRKVVDFTQEKTSGRQGRKSAGQDRREASAEPKRNPARRREKRRPSSPREATTRGSATPAAPQIPPSGPAAERSGRAEPPTGPAADSPDRSRPETSGRRRRRGGRGRVRAADADGRTESEGKVERRTDSSGPSSRRSQPTSKRKTNNATPERTERDADASKSPRPDGDRPRRRRRRPRGETVRE